MMIKIAKQSLLMLAVFVCAALWLVQSAALAAGLAQIKDVRVSANDDKVRIVADADKEVDYESFALSSPNRIVVDLDGAKLGKNVDRDIDVDSSYVKRVRIGQFDKDTVRVVVESDVKRSEYDVFGIVGGSSPYRVAMDFGHVESYGGGSDNSGTSGDNEQNQNSNSGSNSNSNAGNSNNQNQSGSIGDVAVNDPSVKAALEGKVITIDPGHGGSDTGAIGPDGFYEKTATLAVGLDLAEMLKQSGAKVFITRRSDVDVAPQPATDSEELQARCDVGNLSDSDIFLSIHMDSFTSLSANGTTGYYYTNGSSDSRRLADDVKTGVIEALGTLDRGTKTSNFYVVKNTTMPATLVEVAFVSNPDEEAMLSTKDGQLNAAEGIFNGIVRYFQGK